MTYGYQRDSGHMRGVLKLLLPALLFLPACTAKTDFKSIPSSFEPKTTQPSTGKPTPSAPSVTVPESRPSDVPRSAVPQARPAPAKAVLSEPKRMPQTRVAARPSPIASTGELAGRTVTEVTALLGKPEFRRKDGVAEVWRYDGVECFLDVFFYESQGAVRVKHAEVRRRAGASLSEKACIGDAVS